MLTGKNNLPIISSSRAIPEDLLFCFVILNEIALDSRVDDHKKKTGGIDEDRN